MDFQTGSNREKNDKPDIVLFHLFVGGVPSLSVIDSVTLFANCTWFE